MKQIRSMVIVLAALLVGSFFTFGTVALVSIATAIIGANIGAAWMYGKQISDEEE